MLKILFICTHNRCRSILAEAISNHYGKGLIIAKSAGSSPAGEVHPLTLQHLQDRGIAIHNLSSKSWENLHHFEPDIVITVCDTAAKETCPLWIKSSPQLHWGLKDPSKIDESEELQNAAFDQCIAILQQKIDKTCQWINRDIDLEQLTNNMRTLG